MMMMIMMIMKMMIMMMMKMMIMMMITTQKIELGYSIDDILIEE